MMYLPFSTAFANFITKNSLGLYSKASAIAISRPFFEILHCSISKYLVWTRKNSLDSWLSISIDTLPENNPVSRVEIKIYK